MSLDPETIRLIGGASGESNITSRGDGGGGYGYGDGGDGGRRGEIDHGILSAQPRSFRLRNLRQALPVAMVRSVAEGLSAALLPM